jgi:ribonuclease HI
MNSYLLIYVLKLFVRTLICVGTSGQQRSSSGGMKVGETSSKASTARDWTGKSNKDAYGGNKQFQQKSMAPTAPIAPTVDTYAIENAVTMENTAAAVNKASAGDPTLSSNIIHNSLHQHQQDPLSGADGGGGGGGGGGGYGYNSKRNFPYTAAVAVDAAREMSTGEYNTNNNVNNCSNGRNNADEIPSTYAVDYGTIRRSSCDLSNNGSGSSSTAGYQARTSSCDLSNNGSGSSSTAGYQARTSSAIPFAAQVSVDENTLHKQQSLEDSRRDAKTVANGVSVASSAPSDSCLPPHREFQYSYSSHSTTDSQVAAIVPAVSFSCSAGVAGAAEQYNGHSSSSSSKKAYGAPTAPGSTYPPAASKSASMPLGGAPVTVSSALTPAPAPASAYGPTPALTLASSPAPAPAAKGPAPLAPEVLARIEANRQAALAKLHAAKQLKLQQQQQHGMSSTIASSTYFATPSTGTYAGTSVSNGIGAMGVVAVPTAAPKIAVATIGAEAVGVTMRMASPMANMPPSILRAPTSEKAFVAPQLPAADCASGNAAAYVMSKPIDTCTGGSHTFTTGKGKSLLVSDARVQQAEALLNVGVSAIQQPVPQRPLSSTFSAPVRSAVVNAPPVSVSVSVSAPISTTTSAAPSSAFPPAVVVGALQPSAPYNIMLNSTNTSNGNSANASATLFFDGDSLGNPGKGGSSYQLFAPNGRTICQNPVLIPNDCTKNQAEYVGVIHGMEAAARCGVRELKVFGDSELVVKQLLGVFPVRNPALQPLHHRAQQLRNRFIYVQLQWVPKDKNTAADALARYAMHYTKTNNSSFASSDTLHNSKMCIPEVAEWF